jgi:hypothetical protein
MTTFIPACPSCCRSRCLQCIVKICGAQEPRHYGSSPALKLVTANPKGVRTKTSRTVLSKHQQHIKQPQLQEDSSSGNLGVQVPASEEHVDNPVGADNANEQNDTFSGAETWKESRKTLYEGNEPSRGLELIPPVEDEAFEVEPSGKKVPNQITSGGHAPQLPRYKSPSTRQIAQRTQLSSPKSPGRNMETVGNVINPICDDMGGAMSSKQEIVSPKVTLQFTDPGYGLKIKDSALPYLKSDAKGLRDSGLTLPLTRELENEDCKPTYSGGVTISINDSQTYASELGKDIYDRLQEQLKLADWQELEQFLPDLLKNFAIKFSKETTSQMSRDITCFLLRDHE